MRATLCLACLILVSPCRVDAQTWTLRRELTIGSSGDESAALTNILGLALGPDNHLYVTQWQVPALTVFIEAGKQVRTIGRQGRGPGEFIFPAAVGWKGDTLWATDPQQSRLSFFERSGRFISAVNFNAEAPAPHLRNLTPDGVLADGSILSMPAPAGSGLAAGGRVIRVPLLRVKRTGEVIDTIALAESALDVARLELAARRGFTLAKPMSSRPIVASSPDGASLLIVERPVSENRAQAAYRVTRVDISGDTAFSREYRYQPVAVSNPLRNRVYRELTDNITNSEKQIPRARIEEIVRETIRLPAFHPPVSGLVAGSDGTIWIRREDSGADTVRWDILDSSGAALGSVDHAFGTACQVGESEHTLGCHNGLGQCAGDPPIQSESRSAALIQPANLPIAGLAATLSSIPPSYT